METKLIYKDEFAVIGRMAEGPSDKPYEWVPPLWEEANAVFSEISGIIRHDENGLPAGVWGAMNDTEEQNKRWSQRGRYMASWEADTDVAAPAGWHKWVIPAQTYLTVHCTMEQYGEIFSKMTNDEKIHITGTVHERYPEPGNAGVLEIWFPVAAGMLFCQSCGMPLMRNEDLGKEADGSKNLDYCCHCYSEGKFSSEETMEEMIESCVPFVSNGNPYANEDEARKAMQMYFPMLKRWKK